MYDSLAVRHDGDCCIFAALDNGNAYDGICTCGAGMRHLRETGDDSCLLSQARHLAAQGDGRAMNKAIVAYIKKCGHANGCAVYRDGDDQCDCDYERVLAILEAQGEGTTAEQVIAGLVEALQAALPYVESHPSNNHVPALRAALARAAEWRAGR